ncbi:MAG: SynChlorMet cassette protein ScmC [Candidatus Aminicenantes bacterium]|nr:SynChlorMet cassette protein ScmC [Candidatus Aminicenantes bacterium]
MSRSAPFLVFRLRLGPTVWRIAAGPELEDWMTDFARILSLKRWTEDDSERGEDQRTALFLPGPDRSSAEFPDGAFFFTEGARLPSKGWTATKLNNLVLWRHALAPAVIVQLKPEETEESRVAAMSEACLPFYFRVIETGGLPLHAAVLARKDKAVALAASGGTGKSTCARRAPHPWRALGDDLAVVTRADAGGSFFSVNPFPTWSNFFFKRGGGAWRVEERLPLSAIFFLAQSKEDNILRLGQGEAAVNLARSGHQILFGLTRKLPLPELRSLWTEIFDNACRMVRRFPVFLLETSLTGSFWKKIERVI